jgi:hypothetical protein
MGAPAKQTGLSSLTEPSCTVSALTGFDPSRGADNILPLLTNEQKAFILRMEPSLLDQEIGEYEWDNIDPKVDNPDLDGWPYWHWFGGMRLTWPYSGATDPEITFRFNPDGLAVRDALIAAQGTEAQRAETATEIGGSVHDGPVPEGNAP